MTAKIRTICDMEKLFFAEWIIIRNFAVDFNREIMRRYTRSC